MLPLEQPVTLRQSFTDSGFFVLRTPLLPFDELTKWGDLVQSAEAFRSGSSALAVKHAWQADIQLLRLRLREIVARPEVRHALFAASRTLEASIDQWKRDPDSKRGLQTERSLVRYFARMCGRPTPFGLFSGCSPGVTFRASKVNVDDLRLQSRDHYRLSFRLDYEYMVAMTAGLRDIPEIVEDLKYWPNSSLHKTGDVWHYLQSRAVDLKSSYSLVKLYSDQYLDGVLEHARGGAHIADLVQILMHLAASPVISQEEATAYIKDLIRSDVLVASLAPLLTGENPIIELVEQLNTFQSGVKWANRLESVWDGMETLQEAGVGASPAEYGMIASQIEALPGKTDRSRLFQIDMVKPPQELSLSDGVVSEFIRGIELLIAIGANSSDMPRKLRSFRDRFEDRYGHAWVPLTQALDEEAGIGLDSGVNGDASPLLRGLGLRDPTDSRRQYLREPHVTLLQKLVDNAYNGDLLIQASDFPRLEEEPCHLPDAFSLMGTIVARSAAAIRSGDFRVVLQSGAGPSGAAPIGRFCNADQELNRLVRNHLRKEESLYPDAVYAEVVHLPEGSIGNILCRPVLRDYEIVYLGRSGASIDRQLPVSDLLVTVAPNGDILLYSERLGKQVIPRLTAAHAFNQRMYPSVYRFLCYLQYEPWTNVPVFEWGPLDHLSFLPRVRSDKVVLSLARWRISREEAKKIGKQDRGGAFHAVQELRKIRDLPRWVSFVERDKTLPTDLDNALSVDAFVHILKRAGQAVLQEMYPSPDELCVTGPEGRFQHEVVIPFLRHPQPDLDREPKRIQERSTLRSTHSVCDATTRKLPPGSDWLFVKIYGGSATLDEILKTTVSTLVRSTSAQGLISRWFFIRYLDPHPHLRIRFQSQNPHLAEELLRSVAASFNPLLMTNRLWKLELDTYEREIERYGGLGGMLAAEDIFFADSEAVLNILQSLDDETDPQLRWKLGILSIDKLLSDCGLDGPERMIAVQRARASYWSEFRVRVEGKVRLGRKFRQERETIEALLSNVPDENPAIRAARKALETRSERVRLSIQNLRSLRALGLLDVGIGELALSYIHMHVVRLIPAEQRAHELVLYDFLSRVYEGRLARQRKCEYSVAAPMHERWFEKS